MLNYFILNMIVDKLGKLVGIRKDKKLFVYIYKKIYFFKEIWVFF